MALGAWFRAYFDNVRMPIDPWLQTECEFFMIVHKKKHIWLEECINRHIFENMIEKMEKKVKMIPKMTKLEKLPIFLRPLTTHQFEIQLGKSKPVEE